MRAEPRVFIVDDEADMRSSLQRLLSSAGFKSEAFDSAEAFLAGVDANACGCLLADIRLGGMSGLDLQSEMRSRGPTLPCILISGYADIPSALRAGQSGAFALLEKPLDDAALMDCVERAFAEDQKLRDSRAARNRYMDRQARLTPRQREIMELLVSGKSTKEIAHRLKLSVKTVDVHRRNVLEKFDVDDVVGLVHLTYEHSDAEGLAHSPNK